MTGPVRQLHTPRPAWTPFELFTLLSSIVLLASPLLALGYAVLQPSLTAAQAGPDLRVSKVATSLIGANLATVAPNQEFYYEIRVQTSSTTTVNLTLTDAFPPSVRPVAITDRRGGDCALSGNQVTCSLSATSQTGASVLVRSRVAANAANGSQITNRVQVKAGTSNAIGAATLVVGNVVVPSSTPRPTATTAPASPTPTTPPPSPTATMAPASPTATAASASPTATAAPASPTATTGATATAEPSATAAPPATAASANNPATTAAATATSEPATSTPGPSTATPAGTDTSARGTTAQPINPTATTASRTAAPQPTDRPGAPTAGIEKPAATRVPVAGAGSSQPTATRVPVAGSGGKQPPDTRSLGNNLPATSGGVTWWVAPLAGAILMVRTIRVRRGKLRAAGRASVQ